MNTRTSGARGFLAGTGLLLAAACFSSGCTPVPATAYWRRIDERSGRTARGTAGRPSPEKWTEKWSRMSEKALVISFTGYMDNPENEKAINNCVERQLKSMGAEIGPGTPHQFLELGWRWGARSAWKAIGEYIAGLPEGVEPRIILFGHSLGGGRALDISAALAKRGVPVAALGMADENRPWSLTISRDRIPENVARVFNARGDTWWSDFSGLRGRAFKTRNSHTEINPQQDFPGTSHPATKSDPAIIAGMAGMIKRALGASRTSPGTECKPEASHVAVPGPALPLRDRRHGEAG